MLTTHSFRFLVFSISRARSVTIGIMMIGRQL